MPERYGINVPERYDIGGSDIQSIEAALDAAGFDATVVEYGPSDYASSGDRPAASVTLHLEPTEGNDGD